MNQTIIPATLDDAPFVAWAVITAMGIENPGEDFMSNVIRLCSREDVLYSWHNTILAKSKGKTVGCLTCYNGADYLKMREVTFPLIEQDCSKDFSNSDIETTTGEFYLDSISVLPEYRNQGVATALLKAGIEKAVSLDIHKVSMIVSPENTSARHLYESLGFRFSYQLFAFNENYLKMVKLI